MQTCPPVIGITGTGHPSSYKSFISVTDNEVPAGGSQSRKWRNSLDCSAKWTLEEIRTPNLTSTPSIMCLKNSRQYACMRPLPEASLRASVITVWQIDIRCLILWWPKKRNIENYDEKLWFLETRKWRNLFDCCYKSKTQDKKTYQKIPFSGSRNWRKSIHCLRKPTYDINFVKLLKLAKHRIVKRVIRILATTLWEFSFGGQQSRSAVNYIRKLPQQQRFRFAGPWFPDVNIDSLKMKQFTYTVWKDGAAGNQLSQPYLFLG